MSFSLHDVVFEEGGRRRLGPVSVTLPANEMVGVVGPNGCGKSTLLRLLYGYLKPAQGRVLWDTTAVHQIPPRELAQRIAACPQEAEPSLDFSVEQAIALATSGDILEARSRAEEHPFLALTSLWGRRLSELSGGEKQRVRLARAFVMKSACLVLDEPANHLDLATGWALMESLRRTAASGQVVVALHDLHLATRFCHRLLVLQQGQPMAFERPELALTPHILATVFGLQGIVLNEGGGPRLQIEGVTEA